MAGEGETSAIAESVPAGKGEGEGEEQSSTVAKDSSDVAGKKVEVDCAERAGDGASSSHQEPSVSAGGASPVTEGLFRGFPPMETWPFNPPVLGPGFDFSQLGAQPLVPVLLPAPFPNYFSIPGQDQVLPPGGIFAVPLMPMFGPVGGIPQGGFIPMSFNLPPIPQPSPTDVQSQVPVPGARPAEVARAAAPADGGDLAAPNGLRQRHVRPPQGAGRPGDPQRRQHVVRRFRVGFQIDLLLILKLAVVVIVFNQDGTKDRLMLLLLLAGIVYLYQTGALAPILRWISQSAQRAMMPPQQPDGPANAEGAAVPQPPNVRDAPAGANVPEAREGTPPGPPAEQDGAAVGEGGAAAAAAAAGEVGERRVEQPPPPNPNWWGFVKELQMIVVGFLTSLLPGFQHEVE